MLNKHIACIDTLHSEGETETYKIYLDVLFDLIY